MLLFAAMLVWFSFTSWPEHTDTPLLPALGHALSTSAVEAVDAVVGVAAFPLPFLAWGKENRQQPVCEFLFFDFFPMFFIYVVYIYDGIIGVLFKHRQL